MGLSWFFRSKFSGVKLFRFVSKILDVFFCLLSDKKYTSKCLLFKIFFSYYQPKNCTCKYLFSCYQPINCTCKCIFICNCTQKWFFVCYQPRNSTCKCVPVCVGGCVGLSGADVANVRVNVCLLWKKNCTSTFLFICCFSLFLF